MSPAAQAVGGPRGAAAAATRPHLPPAPRRPSKPSSGRTLPPSAGDESCGECDGTHGSERKSRSPEITSVGRARLGVPIRAGRRGRRGGRPRAGRPSASSAVRRPATRAQRGGVEYRTRPLANGAPVVVDDLDRVVGVERALDLPHPGRRAATGRRRHSAAPGAVVDDDPPDGARARTRSTACGSTAAAARGCTTVPTARPSMRVDAPRRARRRPAITARTPDHAAILAAASLLAIPPLPRAVPAPPATASSAASTSTISSISDASGVEPRIGGEQPGGVGEQHEHVGARRGATTSAARRSLSP